VGGANLSEQSYGPTGVGALGYNSGGWDGTSTAASTYRLDPGNDAEDGAYFRATGASQITLGNNFSFEAIVQADHATLSGGSFNLSYIISSRPASDRGYFLTQGGPIPSTGVQFASTMGNGHNASNTNTIVPTITVGNWYYLAGSHVANPGVDVTWTNYYADLTAGDMALTTAGPFTNSGGTYGLATAMDFGIGGRWDGQEAFDGQLDEVSFYNTNLGAAAFQANLDALLIPEPSRFALLGLGLTSFLLRRRRS